MTKGKNNAFSIIELIVAMGLLVMLIGLSSAVFSLTVKAHRKAAATIEITRNLRVITEQLNADFRGLRSDAPFFLRFCAIGNDEDGDGSVTLNEYAYYDIVHFFTDGDFQSIHQYLVRYDSNYDGEIDSSDSQQYEIISGDVARIYYGHANSVDFWSDSTVTADYSTHHVLSRKSHILTGHEGAAYDYNIPAVEDKTVTPPIPDYSLFTSSFGQTANYYSGSYSDENCVEFNTISLTQWINALDYTNSSSTPVNADAFINYCMDDDSRPYINLEDYQTLSLLMSQGVLSFSVQWAYTPDDLNGTVSGFDDNEVRWWPSVDPDGDGDTSDSDFLEMGLSEFGVYLTLSNGTSVSDWFAMNGCKTDGVSFSSTFYPKALKFTFKLKDSNNIFPDGKIFTHIVYLDN